MRANVLFNVDSMFLGWAPGNRLLRSERVWDLGQAPLDKEPNLWAAEQAFWVGNQDDRPNGQVERSVSAGDVVLVATDDPISPWAALACQGVGWQPLSLMECRIVGEYEKELEQLMRTNRVPWPLLPPTVLNLTGHLEVHADRGALYFHLETGQTLLRIQGLPVGMPVDDFVDVRVTESLVSWKHP